MNYLNLKSLKNKYSKDGFVIVRKLLSKKEVTFFENKEDLNTKKIIFFVFN